MVADVRSAVFRYDRRSKAEADYYEVTILRPSSIPGWDDAVVINLQGREATVLQSALMLAPPCAPASTGAGGER